MTAEGAEKSQQCHKYFLQYTVHLLPKSLRFEHAGAKLASCPGRHPGPQPGFEVWRGKIHFRGARISLLLYFWNKFFWEQENLGVEQKKFWEALPPNAPPWLRAWRHLTWLRPCWDSINDAYTTTTAICLS